MPEALTPSGLSAILPPDTPSPCRLAVRAVQRGPRRCGVQAGPLDASTALRGRWPERSEGRWGPAVRRDIDGAGPTMGRDFGLTLFASGRPP
jgi:hypothetical protein